MTFARLTFYKWKQFFGGVRKRGMSYVVQERAEPVKDLFPVLQGGALTMRQMEIEVHPHIYLGKVDSCSTEVKDATPGFSTLSGLAPTLIVESGS